MKKGETGNLYFAKPGNFYFGLTRSTSILISETIMVSV